jgi:hypothetical protein
MSRPFSHDWKTRAQAAREALRDVPEGKRELKLRELAGARDLNTLRRALTAFNFLQRWIVEQPAAGGVLQEAPQAIVEVIARWAAFDVKGALDSTRRWQADKIPIDQLTGEMQAARAGKGVAPGKAIGLEYRKSAMRIVEDLVARRVSGLLTRPEINYKSGDDPNVDYRFLAVDPKGDLRARSVACIIVGPYRNPGLYKKRRLDWLSRAFTLAWVHDVVVMVLPDDEQGESYERWIKDFTRRATELRGKDAHARAPEVLVVTPLAPEDEAALARLAES